MKLEPENWRPPMVVLVGLGMGKQHLSPHTLRWIESAEVLVGGARQLDAFPEHRGQRIPLQAPLKSALDRIESVAREFRTAVLASGDPFYFGIGRKLVSVLGKERLYSIPNITTVQALFARLAEPWDDVKVISLHGRSSGSGVPSSWLREVRRYPRIAIFTDPEHTPDRIARQLLEQGAADRRLVVAENLGLDSEVIQFLSLEEASKKEYSPLNLVAILPADDSAARSREDDLPVLGLGENEFRHQASLITKMEIRAVVLAHLQLRANLVLWDLGAGSGSVSIEAARMVPLQQVVAVEKDSDRYTDLVDNIRRFWCGEIHAIHGNARDLPREIPDPDRVFVGGSGGDLVQILEKVRRRLRPGGRVVQAAVTWDTLDTVRSFWKGKPFELTVTQLQANRSVPIGNSMRFEALNPVFIITVFQRTFPGGAS